MKYAEKYKAIHEGAEYKILDPKTGKLRVKKGNYGNGAGFKTVLKPLKKFIDEHPSMQILGLAFLILIGFMLITEAAHLSETSIFDQTVGAIPKGYLYFAIAFSLFVEFLNFKMQKKRLSNK